MHNVSQIWIATDARAVALLSCAGVGINPLWDATDRFRVLGVAGIADVFVRPARAVVRGSPVEVRITRCRRLAEDRVAGIERAVHPLHIPDPAFVGRAVVDLGSVSDGKWKALAVDRASSAGDRPRVDQRAIGLVGRERQAITRNLQIAVIQTVRADLIGLTIGVTNVNPSSGRSDPEVRPHVRHGLVADELEVLLPVGTFATVLVESHTDRHAARGVLPAAKEIPDRVQGISRLCQVGIAVVERRSVGNLRFSPRCQHIGISRRQ